MRFFDSLRGRVAMGAVLWTIGLFTLTSLFVVQLLTIHPHAVATIHRTLGHTMGLGLVALGLLLIGLRQIAKGLSPISQLRQKLSDVHRGNGSRLAGRFPSEVQPLVDDLNSLLDQHDAAVTRAQAKAGDLAHGLRTPLAVLTEEARSADAAGHHELAAAIRQQVDRMRRQIDWHLAHARAAASSAAQHARCVVAESVDGLVRTVRQIYAERALDITSNVPATLAVRVERQDLDEMIGNLMDNACKWATSRVAVSAVMNASSITILVDDDGPGVPTDRREEVLRRGVRADESMPGSGFGLAIVSDLATVYAGSIRIDYSPLGGTRAALTLPSHSQVP